MSLKLDRLQRAISLIDRDGLPSSQFQLFWQRTMEAIEGAINNLTDILVRLGVVEVTADGALDLAQQVEADLGGVKAAPVILQAASDKFANGRVLAEGSHIDIADGGAGGAITVALADSPVTPGTFGSASLVPILDIDSKGVVTAVSTAAITAASVGAVSSIDASGGTTGLTFSGGPITSSGTLTLSGTLGIANGGTGATSAPSARTALGLAIGSDVQAYSAKLAAYAGGDTPSAFVLGIVDSVDAVAFRTAIGAGTSSTTGTVTSVQASGGTTGLTFSGGPITGSGTLTLGGTLALANGGTGATTAAGARSNLGLGTAAVENYSTGTWTPTISAGSGTITTASATGAYTRVGRLVVINVAITITTNGTGGTFVAFTLPFAAVADSSGCGRETAVTGDMLQAFLAGGTSSAFIQRYDTAYPGADGRTLKITASYYV